MSRWIDHMSQHACPSAINFSPVFFGWLHRWLIIIDDYPYVWMDFHDDPELELPKDEQRDS